LLWAYSPSCTISEKKYLRTYPGNDYVDILGMDCYNGSKQSKNFVEKIKLIVNLAENMGKISALTETGSNGIEPKNWFTKHLLDPIKTDPIANRIAWILVWRNWKPDHCFVSYPRHKSVPDFINFY